MTQQEKQQIIPIKLTTIFTGICSACAIGILGFIWQMREDVPVLKQTQIIMQKQMEDMQHSITALAKQQSVATQEQVRQGTQLEYIRNKMK